MARSKKQKRIMRLHRGGAIPTFHVLIVSGGRSSLKNMLNSLKSQLREGDGLTVVFDGAKAKGLSQYNETWKEGFKCPFTMIEEEVPMGKFGQPLHNKYQSLLEPRTTYIMHADDDDEYLPGAFDGLREKCTDPTRLYIVRMKSLKTGEDQPLTSDVTLGLVGTPSGITPFDDAPKARWGENPKGDFDYYNDLKTKVASIEFLPNVIYQIGQDQGEVNVNKLKGGKKNRKRKTLRKYRGGSVPTFHILIPSGGRPSLKGMLDSLKPQLQKDDAVTVIFDGGQEARKKAGFTEDFMSGFTCKTNVIDHTPRLNQWSHGIQNAYQNIAWGTTFVMYGDDDDTYTDTAFDTLRKKCTDINCLYIAKMTYVDNPGSIIPNGDNGIRFGNIGTPCGIIPVNDVAKVKWGLLRGGDFHYYNELQHKVKRLEHLPDIIYKVGPDQGNVK